MSDEESAVAAVAAIPSSLKIRVKFLKFEHFEIVKMNTEFDVSKIPGLIDSAIHSGNSRMVRLKFKSKEDLDLAFMKPLNYLNTLQFCSRHWLLNNM